MIALHPIADQILLQPVTGPLWSEGGVILPEIARPKPNHGWAIAVGPRCWDIKVGDDVYYDFYAVTEIRLEGHPFVMLREREAIAKAV